VFVAVVEPLAVVIHAELHLNPDSENYANPRLQLECIFSNVSVTLRTCQVLWNQLSFSLRQPYSGTSSSISYSPIPSSITSSSSDSPLCTSIAPSLFHSRLKTYLFHKSYPVVSLLPSGLSPRTFAWTVSSELLSFYFSFSLFFRFWAVR